MTDWTRNVIDIPQEEGETHRTLRPGTPESTGIGTIEKYGVKA